MGVWHNFLKEYTGINMTIITLDKKKYSELIRDRDIIERILSSTREKRTFKKNGFTEAFGILKNRFKGNSLDYISKLRKEWRN